MCTCPDYIDEEKVCDSHVDCYDWGDEGKKCDYCKKYAYQGKTWYCHLSKECIRKEQVTWFYTSLPSSTSVQCTFRAN